MSAVNKHLIEARYTGASERLGSRLRLVSFRFENDAVIGGWNHELSGVDEQGRVALEALGYSIACMGESPRGFIFAVNEFIGLREAKAKWLAHRKAVKGGAA